MKNNTFTVLELNNFHTRKNVQVCLVFMLDTYKTDTFYDTYFFVMLNTEISYQYSCLGYIAAIYSRSVDTEKR
jgi:hypothetical protein